VAVVVEIAAEEIHDKDGGEGACRSEKTEVFVRVGYRLMKRNRTQIWLP
jgi:hypothetical protein